MNDQLTMVPSKPIDNGLVSENKGSFVPQVKVHEINEGPNATNITNEGENIGNNDNNNDN